jgi:hypothetical protein
MSRNTDEKNPASRIASMKKTMRMNDGQALVMMVAFRVVPKSRSRDFAQIPPLPLSAQIIDTHFIVENIRHQTQCRRSPCGKLPTPPSSQIPEICHPTVNHLIDPWPAFLTCTSTPNIPFSTERRR